MIQFSLVFYQFSFLLFIMAGAMLVPAFVLFFSGLDSCLGFFYGSLITVFFGALLFFGNRGNDNEACFSIKDSYFLTVLSWGGVSVFSAIPLFLSELSISYLDCYFEVVSAITTTGSTIIYNLDGVSDGVLLWRALLQWFGGIGIIVTAIGLIPNLKGGGSHLFKSEFTERTEKILPKFHQYTRQLFIIYCALTLIVMFLLLIFGMSFFDAIFYSMTSLSTGGMSSSSMGLGAYDGMGVDMVVAFGCFLGSISLVLFLKGVKTDFKSLLQDSQLRFFISIILVSVLVLTAWAVYVKGLSLEDAFINALTFTVFSSSTAGFSVDGMSTMGALPVVFMCILSFIGGCSGSTTGGVKVFRVQTLIALVRSCLHKQYSPNSLIIPKYFGGKLKDEDILGIVIFFACYLATIFVTVAGISVCDVEFGQAFSAVFTSITNYGVSFGGGELASAVQLAALPVFAKICLMFAMIVGRLECLVVMAVFSASFWK